MNKQFSRLMGNTVEQLTEAFGRPFYSYPNLYIYRTENALLFVKLKTFTMFGEEYDVPAEIIEGYALFSNDRSLIEAQAFELLSGEATVELEKFIDSETEDDLQADFFKEHPCLTSAEGNFIGLIYVTDTGMLLCVNPVHKAISRTDFFDFQK